jgi:hypothetical protein
MLALLTNRIIPYRGLASDVDQPIARAPLARTRYA